MLRCLQRVLLVPGVEAARCGSQPTAVFVQKGEKRLVSFWHRPEPEDAELGSGEVPEEAPEPTAAAAEEPLTTPLIVTAGPPQQGPPTPLYDQQPHIILPEAPPPPPPADEAAAEELESVTESDWEALKAADGEQGGSSAVNDDISGQQAPLLDSAVDGDTAEGSGSTLFDGDDLFTVSSSDDIFSVPSSDADSPVQTSETFGFTTEGSGQPETVSITNALKDSSTLVFINDAPAAEGETISFGPEGSGDIAMDPAADSSEGSGAAESAAVPEVFTEVEPAANVTSAGDAAAAVVSPTQDALSAAVSRVQTLVVSDFLESDGLETDELLPLLETYSGGIAGDEAGDLAVSGSEPVAAVVAAPAAAASEAEKERLLVLKELQEDRVILEDVPDAAEGGSGDGPELWSAAGAGNAASDGEVALDGSGMSEGERQEEKRQHMETEIIKAVVDVMSIMTDMHGLVDKEETVKPAEEPEKATYRPSAYRYVETHNKPNHVAAPVRPVWGGYQRYGAPSRFPSGSPRPLRPYPRPGPPPHRPGPVWERLRHRSGPSESDRPGHGHVYFPGQFRRGGRPGERRATFRPPGGGGFAARLDDPRPPLAGYLRRGPSPAGYGRPVRFNAKQSIRRQDDNLFR